MVRALAEAADDAGGRFVRRVVPVLGFVDQATTFGLRLAAILTRNTARDTCPKVP